MIALLAWLLHSSRVRRLAGIGRFPSPPLRPIHHTSFSDLNSRGLDASHLPHCIRYITSPSLNCTVLYDSFLFISVVNYASWISSPLEASPLVVLFCCPRSWLIVSKPWPIVPQPCRIGL